MVARKSIQAVGKIALRLPARANICVDKLLSLLILEIDYVTSETLVVMMSEWVGSIQIVGGDQVRLCIYRGGW